MTMEVVLCADDISRGVERRKIPLEDPDELVNVADFVVGAPSESFDRFYNIIMYKYCLNINIGVQRTLQTNSLK